MKDFVEGNVAVVCNNANEYYCLMSLCEKNDLVWCADNIPTFKATEREIYDFELGQCIYSYNLLNNYSLNCSSYRTLKENYSYLRIVSFKDFIKYA